MAMSPIPPGTPTPGTPTQGLSRTPVQDEANDGFNDGFTVNVQVKKLTKLLNEAKCATYSVKEYQLTCNPTTTIGQLKQAISTITHIPLNHLNCVIANKIFSDTTKDATKLNEVETVKRLLEGRVSVAMIDIPPPPTT